MLWKLMLEEPNGQMMILDEEKGGGRPPCRWWGWGKGGLISMWLWLRSPLEVLLDDEGDAEDDGGGADKPASSHHHLLAGLLAWAEKRVGEETKKRARWKRTTKMRKLILFSPSSEGQATSPTTPAAARKDPTCRWRWWRSGGEW